METYIGQVKSFFTDCDWYLQKRRFNIAVRAETVQEFLKNQHFDSILDIGCGDGSLSLPLLNSHRQLTLLDLSSKMLSIAQSRVPSELQKNVGIVNDEFMQAKLEKNSYDLVICVGVLAFVKSLDDFIFRITSLLKPNGAVIIENSDAGHFYTSFVRFSHRLRRAFAANGLPTNVYSSQTVLQGFRKQGMELSGMYRYAVVFPLVQKMMSQGLLYKVVRRWFGTAERNRHAWMGNECLYYFQRSSAPATKPSLPGSGFDPQSECQGS